MAYCLDNGAAQFAAADRDTAQQRMQQALLALLTWLRECDYRFISVTPATHAKVNARAGSRHAHSLRDFFGWSRPFSEEGLRNALPHPLIATLHAADLLVPHEDGWKSRVRVSSLNKHLFVHSAYPTTATNAVFFGPDTYRFAAAIAQALAQRDTAIGRAADIGCGAGPGAIVVAEHAPDAQVFALDINDTALSYTAVNASFAGTARVLPMHSNVLSAVSGEFDFIVANPPYLVDASARAYRHGGGTLGYDLSLAIVAQATERLAPKGTLVLYTGSAIVDGVDHFYEHARALIDEELFEHHYAEVDADIFAEELETGAYRDADRIAAVVLKLTRRF